MYISSHHITYSLIQVVFFSPPRSLNVIDATRRNVDAERFNKQSGSPRSNANRQPGQTQGASVQNTQPAKQDKSKHGKTGREKHGSELQTTE